MEITVDEKGETYTTSGVIILRLMAAKKTKMPFIERANQDNDVFGARADQVFEGYGVLDKAEINAIIVSEKVNLFNSVEKSELFGKRDRDPMDLYKNYGDKMKLSTEIAHELLSAPIGEASNQHIFSISSRIMGPLSTRMSPEYVLKTTFMKNNRKARR